MPYLGISPNILAENNLTNVQLIDDLSSQFNGSTTTFNLTSSGEVFHTVAARAIFIVLGGVVQDPSTDYSTSGSQITFTTAPQAGLSFAGRKIYGLNEQQGVNDGTVTPAKLNSGGPSWDVSGNTNIDGNLTVDGGLTIGSTATVISSNHDFPTIRPTLDLNFAATKTLDRRITFTRDSLGTFTDDMGIIRYASNNVPRFDHDPITGESLGLLIEESRTNDFAHSDASNSVWASDGGITKTANTTDTKAPDGSFTATKLASQATADSYSQIYDTLSKSSGGVQSVWAKKGTHNVIGIYYFSGSNGIAGWFDLNTGEHRCEGGSKVAAGVQSNGNSNNNTNMVEYPNGWYRCIYYENSNMTYSHIRIVDFDSDIEASSSSNTIYIWGLQAEVNETLATSFIPSLSATMPPTNSTRAADKAKITGTNFTDFHNTTEGTLYGEYKSNSETAPYLVMLSDGTDNNRTIINTNYDSYQGVVKYNNGANQAIIDGGTPINNANNKTALAFKNDDFGLSLNGGTVATDPARSNGVVSVNTMLTIGSRHGSDSFINSTINAIKYYNKRLPNAQLQGLTQQ